MIGEKEENGKSPLHARNRKGLKFRVHTANGKKKRHTPRLTYSWEKGDAGKGGKGRLKAMEHAKSPPIREETGSTGNLTAE